MSHKSKALFKLDNFSSSLSFTAKQGGVWCIADRKIKCSRILPKAESLRAAWAWPYSWRWRNDATWQMNWEIVNRAFSLNSCLKQSNAGSNRDGCDNVMTLSTPFTSPIFSGFNVVSRWWGYTGLKRGDVISAESLAVLKRPLCGIPSASPLCVHFLVIKLYSERPQQEN